MALRELELEVEREEQAVEAEVDSLRSHFEENRLPFRSLSRWSRGLTLGAVALLLAMAGLAWARDLPPLVPVGTDSGGVTTMSEWVATVSAVAAAIAFALLVHGLLRTAPVLRLVGLAVLTFALFPVYMLSLVGFGSPASLVGLTLDLLLVGLWVIAVLTIRRRRNDAVRRWDLPAALALLLLLFAGFAVLDQMVGSALGFTESLTLLLMSMTFLLVPMLVVAGTDFAEWAELAAREGVRTAARLHGAALPVLSALVSAAILGWLVYHLGARLVPAAAAAVGLAAAAAAAYRLVRREPGLAGSVPIGGAVIGAVLVLALPLLLVVAGILSQGFHTVSAAPYRHTNAPTFQLEKPTSWSAEADKVSGGGETVFFKDESDSSDTAGLFVAGAGRSPETDRQARDGSVIDELIRGHKLQVLAHSQEGRWSEWRLADHNSSTPAETVVWVTLTRDREWILMGSWTLDQKSEREPVVRRMVSSFSEDFHATPAEEPAALPHQAAWLVGLWGAVLAGALALLAVRRRTTARFGTALFFLACTAAVCLASAAGAVSPLTRGAAGLTAAQLAAAAAGLAVFAWSAWRRATTGAWPAAGLVGHLLALNLGLLVVAALVEVYRVPQQNGGMTVVQAAFVLLALAWDVLMSGQVTNGDSAWFPRPARLPLYLGYLLLVAVAVLYLSSFHAQATGARAESLFESEQWPQVGLQSVGVALLVTLFAARVSPGRSSRAAPARDPA